MVDEDRSGIAEMGNQLKLSQRALRALCCPVCKSQLTLESGGLQCQGPDCGVVFPVVDGVPVLINEANSVFSPDEITADFATSPPVPPGLAQRLLARVVPRLGRRLKTREHCARFESLVTQRSDAPIVVILGGGIEGEGTERLLSHASIEFIETDVYIGPRTSLVCDAHDIPFRDGTFDGAIIQTVLEHVIDPKRCVREIHRVLAAEGLVYAETAFLQAVHAGKYDFQRFSPLAHRVLFRHFEEIAEGAVMGPGTALAWAYRSFLLAFSTSPRLRLAIKAFGNCTSFWLKYFDYLFQDSPSALDGASQLYFLGRKSEKTLSDRDLIQLYRGCDTHKATICRS